MNTKLIPALVAAGLLSSCATILSESNYPVTFNTNPSGGDITISNEAGTEVYKGTTPTTLTLPAGNGYFSGEAYSVEATLAGHEPVHTIMETTMDGWYLANILLGGLVGLVLIDPATGAMWKLEGDFTVQMDGSQPAVSPGH